MKKKEREDVLFNEDVMLLLKEDKKNFFFLRTPLNKNFKTT
jgi:hypothetical protein